MLSDKWLLFMKLLGELALMLFCINKVHFVIAKNFNSWSLWPVITIIKSSLPITFLKHYLHNRPLISPSSSSSGMNLYNSDFDNRYWMLDIMVVLEIHCWFYEFIFTLLSKTFLIDFHFLSWSCDYFLTRYILFFPRLMYDLVARNLFAWWRLVELHWHFKIAVKENYDCMSTYGYVYWSRWICHLTFYDWGLRRADCLNKTKSSQCMNDFHL